MLIATVTTQRSGSKLLGACFNKGIAVRSFGEIFHPRVSIVGSFYSYIRARGFDHELLKFGSDEIMDQYVRDQFFTVPSVENRPVHFDVMFNQLEMACTNWNPFDCEFIYGYLRTRNAVVISLCREPKDSFLSREFLAISGQSHRTRQDAPIVHDGSRHRLAPGTFARYRASIKQHQERLTAAMAGYEYFIELNYDELASSLWIPQSIKETIVHCSINHGLSIDPSSIQMAPVDLVPTGVDYSAVFENIDELR